MRRWDDDPESSRCIILFAWQIPPTTKPLRTGALHELGKHVLFTAGKPIKRKLCVIDASA